MQLKIETLEDQMDLKVESLISEIQKYRDEYMDKLKKHKIDLKKLVFLIFVIFTDSKNFVSSD
jgi:hypothetical protein